MITIYDIAKECDCSSSTVSKALNNYADINQKTRARILEVAKKMGYLPNSQAQALATKRTWNIGVIFDDDTHSGITHYFFAQIIERFKKEVEAKGYDITFISKKLGNGEYTYKEHCKWRQVDGVLVACINFNDPQVVELVESDIPTITIDHHYNNSSSIFSDNFSGLYESVKYLASLGHSEIVYIHGKKSIYVTKQRLSGFLTAMTDYSLEIHDGSVVASKYYEKDDVTEKVTQVLKRDKVPTAIIFPDDYAAVWGMGVIQEMGYQIPEDISVIGFDGLEIGEMVRPKLTTIWQNTEDIAINAASYLVSEMVSKEASETSKTIEVSLVIRDSCKKID